VSHEARPTSSTIAQTQTIVPAGGVEPRRAHSPRQTAVTAVDGRFPPGDRIDFATSAFMTKNVSDGRGGGIAGLRPFFLAAFMVAVGFAPRLALVGEKNSGRGISTAEGASGTRPGCTPKSDLSER